MKLINNKKEFRFEALLPDSKYITLGYRWLKGNIVLMNTMIPPAAKGNGTEDLFFASVMDHVRSHNLKMIVYCATLSQYLNNHPELSDLIDGSQQLR